MASEQELRKLVKQRMDEIAREEDAIRARLVPYRWFSQLAVVLGIVMPCWRARP